MKPRESSSDASETLYDKEVLDFRGRQPTRLEPTSKGAEEAFVQLKQKRKPILLMLRYGVSDFFSSKVHAVELFNVSLSYIECFEAT